MSKTETTKEAKMTAQTIQKHEPQIEWARPGSTVNPSGSNWTHVPACSCGWHGDPTFDKGEATRKAYGHAARAVR